MFQTGVLRQQQSEIGVSRLFRASCQMRRLQKSHGSIERDRNLQ